VISGVNLNPKVSIVVPVFNEPEHVVLQSLISLASQTFSEFECLIVDDSTIPESARVCRDFCLQDNRFRYVHPATRLGLAGSLNLGISLAKGELIARFDSDDICMSDRLQLQVAFMETHLDVGVLGGSLEIMDDECKTLSFRNYPLEHLEIERKFHTINAIAHPTVMVRKCIFEAYGGYLPAYRYAEDLELWLRLLKHGVKFANLDVVLVRYRQQNNRRDAVHWQFNLLARIRNFSSAHMAHRTFGICAIAVFMILPSRLQERIFRFMLLSH
jgi:glycosyltransferase involved in cell wall biosynthesis